MTLPTWFSIADEHAIKSAFEARLPPAWRYLSCRLPGGVLIWRRDLSRGFAVEMVVSSQTPRAGGYEFSTTLILSSDELPKLERSAGFDDCMPTAVNISGPRNNDVVASLYVEGLPRFLKQSALWRASWSPRGGIDDPRRWLSLVDEALERFRIGPDEITDLPSTILELGALAERPSPNPVTVGHNAFVGAAEIAVLLGQPERAARIIDAGRSRDWSVCGVKPLDPMLHGFASCQAEKLAAMGYRWPNPS